MSESSPFRTASDHYYRWPIEGFGDVYDTFGRVTEYISNGCPQAWMEDYVGGRAKNCFADNVAELVPYVVREALAPSEEPGAFAIDQQWWSEQLDNAHAADVRAAERIFDYENGNPYNKDRKPSSSNKVAALLAMSPVEKVGYYIAQASARHRDNAATQGTNVHAFLEAMALGEVIDPDSTPYPGHIRAGYEFIKEFKPHFLEVESVVYSFTHGYAGQFDGIIKVPVDVMVTRKQWNSEHKRYEPWTDKRDKDADTYDPDFITVWFDWKTSEKGIKATVPWQIAAYYYADFIGRPDGTKDYIPHCDEFWGVNITSENFGIVPLDVNDEVFAEFLAIKNMAETSVKDHRQGKLLKASDKFLREFAA